MSAPQRYRKKPVEIEAMRLTAENARDVERWINDNGGRAVCAEYTEAAPGGRNAYPFDGALSVFIRTLEGEMRADPGSYVIRGVAGEFYPCAAEVFAATYEAVSDLQAKRQEYARDAEAVSE